MRMSFVSVWDSGVTIDTVNFEGNANIRFCASHISSAGIVARFFYLLKVALFIGYCEIIRV